MALQSLYMKSGHGFLLVFSLTSMESVTELHNVSRAGPSLSLGSPTRAY